MKLGAKMGDMLQNFGKCGSSKNQGRENNHWPWAAPEEKTSRAGAVRVMEPVRAGDSRTEQQAEWKITLEQRQEDSERW
jgi:hypothetical protein